MCPTPFLITASRHRRHSLILLSVKRCESFLPLSDYRSVFPPSWIVVGMVDSLLKSTLDSVIHGINIRAIWSPHVRFNEVDVLFLSSWSGRCALALHPAAVSTCLTTYCSDVKQQTLFEDDIAVVWAVNFWSRIDEDHPCLPHTRYSDRHHDVATEVSPFT